LLFALPIKISVLAHGLTKVEKQRWRPLRNGCFKQRGDEPSKHFIGACDLPSEELLVIATGLLIMWPVSFLSVSLAQAVF